MTDAADVSSCEGPVERPDSHQATFPTSDFVDTAPVARGHGGGGAELLIKGDWAGWGREVGGGRTKKRESAVLPMSCTFIFFSSSPARRFPVGCVSLG